jgi:hypothetical protein
MLFFMLFLTLTGSFQENADLWERIDSLNDRLAEVESSAGELEGCFAEAVDIALSFELSDQLEELRADAYESGDFETMDDYSERAAPAIEVIIMGESNAIGVNLDYFLSLAEPGSQDYEFFDLAQDGFYYQGQIGTAELPQWMERSGSSAQAAVNEELANTYAVLWSEISSQLTGFYLEIALETAENLGGDKTELESEELAAYYAVYENPYVKHFRSAVSAFLEGTAEGLSTHSDIAEQLQNYSDYIQDSFVVLSIDSADMGGKTLLLISQQKPDRIFEVWIYQLGNGEMELRGFKESTAFTSTEVEEIAQRYCSFLEDTEHSI